MNMSDSSLESLKKSRSLIVQDMTKEELLKILEIPETYTKGQLEMLGRELRPFKIGGCSKASLVSIKDEVWWRLRMRKRFMCSAVVWMLGNLASVLASWSITYKAGEDALIALGKQYQDDAIASVEQAMNGHDKMNHLMHRHIHEFRDLHWGPNHQMTGDDYLVIEKFIASWLLHYIRGESACGGMHEFLGPQLNPDQSYLNLGNPNANGGAVNLVNRGNGEVGFSALGFSENSGSILNNLTLRIFSENDRYDTSAWVPGYEREPPTWLTPEMGFFHLWVANPQIGDPCSDLEEGQLLWLPAALSGRVEGPLTGNVGLELIACSPYYHEAPAGVRKQKGMMITSIFLDFMTDFMADLGIVKEKNAFIMVVEMDTGILIGTSDRGIAISVVNAVEEDGNATTAEKEPKPERIRATEHAHTKVSIFAKELLKHAAVNDDWTTVKRSDFFVDFEGKPYIAKVSPYFRNGIRWTILVAVSKQDTMGEVLTNRRGVLVLALFVGLGIKCVVFITVKVLNTLANRYYSKKIDRTAEITDASGSTHTMDITTCDENLETTETTETTDAKQNENTVDSLEIRQHDIAFTGSITCEVDTQGCIDVPYLTEKLPPIAQEHVQLTTAWQPG